MIINTTTKYTYGDLVEYRTGRTPGKDYGDWKRGYVRAIRLCQDAALRSDFFMVYYSVEPVECAGGEHDDDVWVLENENVIRYLRRIDRCNDVGLKPMDAHEVLRRWIIEHSLQPEAKERPQLITALNTLFAYILLHEGTE